MKNFLSSRFCLLAAVFLLPFAVSNDSLWLDEGDTAMYVAQPDLHSWLNRIGHDQGSDCEMPLADFCFWAGSKVIGTHEWQMRAINLFWGALALAGMWRAGRRLQMPWLPWLLAIQPFFCFYLNEARPYALQTAIGAWLLVALVEFHAAKAAGQKWAVILAGAGFLLFCSTMLAPLSVFAIVLAGGLTARLRGWRIERRAVMILLGSVLACVPVGIYYVTTLLRGAKGAQAWHVDWKSFGYVIYEFTGFSGLGLPSEAIRVLARSPHFLGEILSHAPQFALPALGFGLLLAVFILGLRRHRSAGMDGVLFSLVLVLAVTTGGFFAAGLVLKKAFWARHLAAVFPFYVALLGLVSANLWATARPHLRALPLALCGLSLLSALSFRFAPQWRKEDYRSASAFARQALMENKTVWWQAGGFPAKYYGLEGALFQPEFGKAFLSFRSAVDVRTLPLPDIVVLNKPDIHDPSGVVQKIISENHYEVTARYQGFVVWEKPASR